MAKRKKPVCRTVKTKKPLPCPFCGTIPKVSGQNGIWSVDCENRKCLVKPGTTYYNSPTGTMTTHSDTEALAVAAWNRRKP